jgi:putative Ca2+/H+ antiporter (TMEM165/GDT1 family)
MEAFLVSVTSIATAEIGDRTQLLALVLVARYRKPWPIAAGVLCATLANHAVAGLVGSLLGGRLRPALLDGAVGVSMIAMALWTLKPDTLEGETVSTSNAGAFVATLLAFFLAEIGDKTQIATIALAAAYKNLAAVIAGTTCGMMVANVPVIFLGNEFAQRLPLKAIHYAAAGLFAVVGVIFVVRALRAAA